jgi:hypothetical protein
MELLHGIEIMRLHFEKFLLKKNTLQLKSIIRITSPLHCLAHIDPLIHESPQSSALTGEAKSAGDFASRQRLVS